MSLKTSKLYVPYEEHKEGIWHSILNARLNKKKLNTKSMEA